MEQEKELELPSDLQLRLINAYNEDIDKRLKELTVLVSLQETELTLLWLSILGLVGYILVKEHNER